MIVGLLAVLVLLASLAALAGAFRLLVGVAWVLAEAFVILVVLIFNALAWLARRARPTAGDAS
jgi:amino acid transporter